MATLQNLTRRQFLAEARVLDALCLVVCSTCLVYGIVATRDLSWPFDPDLLRDLGQAQSIARGDYFEDPQFSSEGQWYNPLAPGIVGLANRLTGIETNVLYVRLGAYLNILGPLSLYALVTVLFSRRAGLFSMLAFLFVVAPSLNVPYAPTYTPWLYSLYVTQSLFNAGLASYACALRSNRWVWYVISGVLLGGAFLGHAFPAIVLGLIMLSATSIRIGSQWKRGLSGSWRPTLVRFFVLLTVGLVVSLPFSYTLLFTHRLHVVNHMPTSWIYPVMQNPGDYLGTYLSWATPLVVWGMIQLLRQRASVERQILLIWVAIVWAWIAYIALGDWLQGRGVMPDLRFSMHANFYFGVLQAVLFGLGSSALVAFAHGRMARKFRWSWERSSMLCSLLPALLLLASFLPSYGSRAFYTDAREASLRVERVIEDFGALEWIRNKTDPNDVFLANDPDSLYIVVPAGRKIVATNPMYSNPYVDVAERRKDRDSMFRYLDAGKWKKFFVLAKRYDVSHLLITRELFDRRAAPAGAFALRFVSRHGVIIRVTYPK